MANDLETRPETSVASLVSGIIQDAQGLLKQQLTLFSSELRRDVTRAKEAAVALMAGAVVSLIGGITLAVTLAELLFWLFPDYLPKWVCYGIVAAVFVAIGAALLLRSREALSGLTLDESVTGLKENVEWKTNTNTTPK